MQFNIEIINVQSSTKPTAKGSYTMLDVAFKRLDTGKIEGKKIMSFTNKEVFSTLNKATQGQQFTVTSEKNEKTTYWDWTAVDILGEAPTAAPTAQPASKGFTSPKSTYETPEERAARQVLIVRQSSLSSAIDLLKNEKKPPSVEEVLRTADVFANWVFQKNVNLEQPDTGFGDMDDDIPL